MQLVFLAALAALACAGVDALSCLPCHQVECGPKPVCPGEMNKDSCGCCDTCAKTTGQMCKGPWDIHGVCDTGLTCVLDKPEDGFNAKGTCQKFVPEVKIEALTSASECPVPLTNCLIDPCVGATCPNHPSAKCEPNYCGGCNAEFKLGTRDVSHDCRRRASTTSTFNSKKTGVCTHNGVTYNEGDSFKIECNNCRCGKNGAALCTKMGCGSLMKPGKAKVEEVNQASKPSDGCVHNGIRYAEGESFKMDCNSCVCGKNGAAGCTLMACNVKVPDFAKVDEIIKGGPKASRGCTHDGKTYAVGDKFKKDCNNCFCGTNGAACTKMACRDMTVKPAIARVDSASEVCEHEGKKYSLGEKYKNDCNMCICGRHGLSTCTRKACSKSTGCLHDNKKYQVGESFKKDCNTCKCNLDGSVSCTEKACPPSFSLWRMFQNKNCTYLGKTYRPMERFTKECNSCLCYPGGRVGCTRRGCPNQGMMKSTCLHEGNRFTIGHRFKDSCDNTCVCVPRLWGMRPVVRCYTKNKCGNNSTR